LAKPNLTSRFERRIVGVSNKAGVNDAKAQPEQMTIYVEFQTSLFHNQKLETRNQKQATI